MSLDCYIHLKSNLSKYQMRATLNSFIKIDGCINPIFAYAFSHNLHPYVNNTLEDQYAWPIPEIRYDYTVLRKYRSWLERELVEYMYHPSKVAKYIENSWDIENM